MVDHRHYTYRITWSEDDGEFVALCAEFPSLSFLAPDQTAALKGLTKLVKHVVEDMIASGEPIPTPFADKEYSGKFQVRIPPEQHRNLAIQAAEQGVSINRLVSAKLS
jgi:predicted HicB family RNase H-like nuclease